MIERLYEDVEHLSEQDVDKLVASTELLSNFYYEDQIKLFFGYLRQNKLDHAVIQAQYLAKEYADQMKMELGWIHEKYKNYLFDCTDDCFPCGLIFAMEFPAACCILMCCCYGYGQQWPCFSGPVNCCVDDCRDGCC